MTSTSGPQLPGTPLTRRGVLGLGAGAVAGILAACGGGKTAGEAAGGGGAGASPSASFSATYSGPAVTLSYWNGFTGGDGPYMQKMVAQFQQEHPNIKVANNTIQWADYYQRMPAAVTAGKGPDVGVMHVEQLSTNAVRKIIVPVDDVAAALGLSEEDFPAAVWKAGIYKDARYGIPLDVHSLAMYWNSDVAKKAGVTEPPADKAAFEAMLAKLKSGGQANPFWMPSRWPAHLMFLSLLWQNGGQPYAEDGSKATFDSPEGVEALQWMVTQITNGNSPKNVAQDSQYVAFKNGKNPVTWDGIWQINDLKGSKVPFGIAAVPKIGDQDAMWASSHNFYITKQTTSDQNKLQAARVFLDWMSKQSAQWAGAGMIPARASVRESGAVTGSTQGPVAAKTDAMHFLPPIPGLGDVQSQTLELAIADAALLKQQPEAALKDAARKATTLMQENAKKFGA
jgi:multiple sugar transport system substrate-binding protein